MRYNNDLLAQFGNLLQRCTSAAINKTGLIPLSAEEGGEQNETLEKSIDTLAERFDTRVSQRDFSGALDLVAELVAELNKYFTDSKPWTLKKPEDTAKLRTTLFYTYEGLRVSAILLQPAMPKTSGEILNRLAVEESERSFANARLGRRWKEGVKNEEVKVVQSGAVIFPKLQ